MTFPVPSIAQPVTGFPVSQAYLTSQVYNVADFLLNKPVATLYLTADWSLVNSVYQTIPFNAALTDNWNGHSNTTNNTRYTVPTSGTYTLSGAATFDTNATGQRTAKIYKNGSAITGTNLWMPANGSNFITLAIPPFPIPCVSGDYLEIAVFQSSGAGLNVKSVGTYMSVEFAHQ